MKLLNYCLILLSIALVTNFAHADDIELRYPELEVSPRASQRLMIEAKKEKNNMPNFKRHAPALTSAIFTMASSFYISSSIGSNNYTANKENEGKKVASAGQFIGAAWIGFLTYQAYTYKPYQSGAREVSRLPSKSKSNQITKERFAEERIYDAAETSQKIAFLSTASNLLISAALTGYGNGDAALFAGLSTLISFAPYYFNNYWQSLADRHKEYKKKIYGPVSMPLLQLDDKGQLISGLQMHFQF